MYPIRHIQSRFPQGVREVLTSLTGSRHGHMRELRVQSSGRPVRVFYAFGPRRTAILLIGGDKTGDAKFYERLVPLADWLYDEHLQELKKEGLTE